MGAGFDPVWLLQISSAFVLVCGFSWLAGSWCARRWLPSDVELHLRTFDLVAAGAAIVAGVLSLLAATAVMGGTGLAEACGMFWMMVSSTAYGLSGGVAIAALLVVLALRWPRSQSTSREIAVAAAMLVFAVTRASMGHAGEEGLWTVAMAAESLHLSAIAVWVGVVAVSGCCVLSARMSAADMNRYLDSMSRAAMGAVVAIVATGIYTAWHRVGVAENLIYTDYGLALLAKIALVLAAIGIGGYNKFIGLPAASRSYQGVVTVRLALRVEMVLLLGAILAAAILTSQQPPSSF
ncbi:copper resistance D family protein [Duganella sp. S19_KUP01_CR8]|uniref:copper resistance D family protein n=1 Tax=Duganella sp. S19_KUP01_CR8 TaxID=3025502 RepID=UPI002FCD9CEC